MPLDRGGRFGARHGPTGVMLAASAAGLVMMAPGSTNPTEADRNRPGVFRTIGRNDDQAAVAGTFILSGFGAHNIALLHDGIS